MPELFEKLSAEEKSIHILDYVKGRASEEIGQQILENAKTDTQIAEELAYYQGLEASLNHDNNATNADEIGWARLNRALDNEQSVNIPEAANDNVSVWRYATVALAMLFVGQSVFTYGNWQQSADSSEQYLPVSEQAGVFVLQVTFASDATEHDIRTLIRAAGGEFSAGPSSLGVYELSFSSEQQLRDALLSFRQTNDVVESVFKK